MNAAEIVCLSLMLVAVLGGAVADWAYLRRIRETRRRITGAP